MLTNREAEQLAKWIASHGNPVEIGSDRDGLFIRITSFWTRPIDGSEGTQTDMARTYSDARAILGY